jgi:integrase
VIIDFAYFTGQRISDVLKIRRTDLTDSGTTFAQSKTGTKLTVAWSDGLRVLAPQ